MKNSVREIREKYGITMKELAQKVGVSEAAMCALEKGRTDSKISLWMRIASVLKCSVNDLIKKED